MLPQSFSADSPPAGNIHKAAREYDAIHNRLFVLRWGLSLLIVAIYLFSGLSEQLANGLRASFASVWIVNGFYIAITIFGFAVLMFPITLYEDYAVENSFGRSEQTLGEWFNYYLRSLAIELAIAIIFFEVLYALLRWMPGSWWFWTSLFYISAAIVFSALAPVFILPLFFKANPILVASWLPRAREMMGKAGLPEINFFQWDFSDRTHAENVVLAGLGKMRRILIADTALENHSDDEILALIAHELGHYHHRDLWTGILIEGFIALAGFFIAHLLLNFLTPLLRFSTPADIAAFPVLVFSLFVLSLILMPALNTISRHREYAADGFAVKLMGTADPLIQALSKAGEQNLSDPRPSPVFEALLHSHPSLYRRIEHARKVEATLGQNTTC